MFVILYMKFLITAADISAAEETRAAFDSRWQRMLRRHGANAEFVYIFVFSLML